MTLITKVSLEMTFLRACARASIHCLCIALQSYWAGAVEAEVFTAQRGKQLLPSENLALSPQASLAAAQGGLCSLNVSPECLMSSRNPPCCWDMRDRVTSLAWPNNINNIHTHKCPWNSFVLGDDCPCQSWRPLVMNSCEKWASLGMIVKIMISSLSGEAVLTKLK